MATHNPSEDAKERKRAYMRDYNSRPEQKEKRRAYRARPEVKARRREYGLRPDVIARNKEYKSRPGYKFYISMRNRLKGIKKHKASLYLKQNGQCKYCERFLLIPDLQIDHIIPKKLGGGNTIDNLQLLCNGCNTVKRDKPETPELIAECRRFTLESCKFDMPVIAPKYREMHGHA